MQLQFTVQKLKLHTNTVYTIASLTFKQTYIVKWKNMVSKARLTCFLQFSDVAYLLTFLETVIRRVHVWMCISVLHMDWASEVYIQEVLHCDRWSFFRSSADLIIAEDQLKSLLGLASISLCSTEKFSFYLDIKHLARCPELPFIYLVNLKMSQCR